MRVVTGDAHVELDASDCAQLAGVLRLAIRLGWLVRGTMPPRALVEFSDAVHAVSREFPASAQVAGSAETASAKPVASPAESEVTSLTVQQAAAILGISAQWVRRLARTGDLTGSRAAGIGAWQLDPASVTAWAARRRQDHHREAA